MPYVELSETDELQLEVFTEYRDRALIRTMPGAKWNRQRSGTASIAASVWNLPRTWAACKMLRGVFGERLEIGPRLISWATHELETRIMPALALREATEHEGDADLFPYQRAGVAFLTTARQALLADEMGTGKTVQTLRALRDLHARGDNPFPAICIAPNSVKRTWRNEAKRWYPDLRCVVITGGATQRRKLFAEIQSAGLNVPILAIINWESTWRHSRLAGYGSLRLSDADKQIKELNLIPWRSVIADEAHRMKDPKSKQTRATWWIAHQSSVEFRYALTGTPIANAPDDLWSVMHFIDPREYASRVQFVDRFALQTWNSYGGMEIVGIRPDTRDELFSFLDPRMRRMPKELVLPFLPPKVRQVRWVELGQKQRRAYDAMESGRIAQLDDGAGVIVAPNALVENTRLLQFASAYAHVDEQNQVQLGEPSTKLDELESVLSDLAYVPTVIAAESRQLIELAAARLDKLAAEAVRQRQDMSRFTYRTLVGGLTDDTRDRIIDDFQQGRCRHLLFTMKAGGVGLTFTRAGVIIFIQRSWSMLDNKQAEDRVHRIGSEIHDKVLIIDIVASDTKEEGQISRLYEKSQRLEEITRDRDLLRRVQLTAEVQIQLARLDQEETRILAEPLWV